MKQLFWHCGLRSFDVRPRAEFHHSNRKFIRASVSTTRAARSEVIFTSAPELPWQLAVQVQHPVRRANDTSWDHWPFDAVACLELPQKSVTRRARN